MDRKYIFEAKSKHGIRIVGEVMPGAYSVSLSVWVRSGSAYENDNERGISHFIEHMVFKGTKRRTAKQLAEEMDAVGGTINAFTGKQSTCFYTRTLSEDMHLALDVLLDMICLPLLSEGDIENEKGVVCEEIYMSEDDPEDVVHEMLCQMAYDGSPIAYPILGTEETVHAFTRDDIIRYMDKRYTPENIVISCAGAFSPEELIAAVDELYIVRGHTGTAYEPEKNAFLSGANYVYTPKDVEQTQICLAFPSNASYSPESSAISIANTAFGGSASSRLFQHIREEKGLAYSVYSQNSSYTDTGYWTVSAGASDANAVEVLRCIIDELRRFRTEGITEAEFQMVREQLRRSYILALETVSTHASVLGRDVLSLGRVRYDDEVLDKLMGTSIQDVNAAMRKVICNDVTLSVVSSEENAELRRIFEETDFNF